MLNTVESVIWLMNSSRIDIVFFLKVQLFHDNTFEIESTARPNTLKIV